ncbi:aromatic amino acid ammonia-lyase [Actinacidiphila sp. DG2A-62]|uniref:aromatic amino acid ammonia-lyase n=1 Tax=Actinacidiphila sp. DG2A-62 TaxID=3108821 RepID=UPI002DB6043C|nr:aromatic amino acid ammonia-lyase [Actinacidiphila sp. DG2A-62]MEC3997001.1 aromatic amino acid ammonia-lyase [Actinacidiphila sp. DG2A-62]
MGSYVVLDGTGLDAESVAAIADREAEPTVLPEAFARAERSWHTARRVAEAGRLYGRHTGVGANRGVPVDPADQAGQDLRLLRSHAGGIGAPLPARQIRAMLAVRANQVLAGGSGIQPAVVTALVEALRLGVHPAVREYGAVGTGDLTALACTGLALIGEEPWVRGEGAGPVAGEEPHAGAASAAGASAAGAASAPEAASAAGAAASVPGASFAGAASAQGEAEPARIVLGQGDALSLMSSNALTLGQAALACHDLGVLLQATHAVAALSLAAVGGSPEAYAAPVHELRPYPGARRAAAEVRRLLALPDIPTTTGRRIQDPYGFRAFPQVHGQATEAAAALARILAVEVNCASENPLISEDGGADGGPAAYHHGGFFAAPLGLALDQLSLTVLQTAQLSVARLTHLSEPEMTGLRAFLATGPATSSGIMVLEYSASSALAEIRASAAAPASAGHAVLSRGTEEAASFASQAARQALRTVDAYRQLLACELVAAVRALRMRTEPLPEAPVFAVLGAGMSAALPLSTEDRSLSGDVHAAAGLLRTLAEL